MSPQDQPAAHDHVPGPGEHSIPELESDQADPPRPEEAIADALRAEPDVTDHAEHPEG
ncbi:hypothetical protein [Agrococcus citreus]|uniref:Uncharacterized protein n=1 Tax=Agrococcus citreus TaxID=84643 RepID=A0ABN1YQX4_9MICO